MRQVAQNFAGCSRQICLRLLPFAAIPLTKARLRALFIFDLAPRFFFFFFFLSARCGVERKTPYIEKQSRARLQSLCRTFLIKNSPGVFEVQLLARQSRRLFFEKHRLEINRGSRRARGLSFYPHRVAYQYSLEITRRLFFFLRSVLYHSDAYYIEDNVLNLVRAHEKLTKRAARSFLSSTQVLRKTLANIFAFSYAATYRARSPSSRAILQLRNIARNGAIQSTRSYCYVLFFRPSRRGDFHVAVAPSLNFLLSSALLITRQAVLSSRSLASTLSSSRPDTLALCPPSSSIPINFDIPIRLEVLRLATWRSG